MPARVAAMLLAIAVLSSPAVSATQAGAPGQSGPSSDEDRADGITPQRFPTGAPEVIYKKATCYGQLVQWFLDLEKAHPGYVKTWYANKDYGTGSIPGKGSAACAPQMGDPYDTLYIRVTNESNGLHKPEAFFMGPLHGDEKAGAQGNYWTTDWMMRTAFDPAHHDQVWTPRVKWLLDNREIYMEASHNPYGYDSTVRSDVDGDDLNREGDYDCCGSTSKGIWGSVNGKTSMEFLKRHQIRVGTDWHGGFHAFPTPWKSTHQGVSGTSPISGRTYQYASADFLYFDVGLNRISDFMGSYSGKIGPSSIGPTPEVLGYQAPGSVGGFFYGADSANNPAEASFVKNGPWAGAGIYWPTSEVSSVKNIAESTLGGDLTAGYGQNMRRFMLYMTDIAQPHLEWDSGSVANNSQVKVGQQVPFKWIVGGALAADNTLIQYGTDPDPVKNPQKSTKENKQFDHKYFGGTLWDGASDGKLTPYVWTESVTLAEPGEYFFVAKSMTDQVYDTITGESVYGKNHTYLRMLKERLQEGWTETINGEDGPETMVGHKWWYSPVIHITVTGNASAPYITQTAPANGATGVPASSAIRIDWSKGMDRASAEGAVTVSPAAAGGWTWAAGDTEQTLSPDSPLRNLTSYFVNVSTGAKDSGGTGMQNPYSFSFTTVKGGDPVKNDTVPPGVVSTVPPDKDTGVARDRPIEVTFSEPMDRASAETAFGLQPARGMTFDWNGNALVATPDIKYDPGTRFTVTIGNVAKDLAGNPLPAPHTFSFTTEGDGVTEIPPRVYFTLPRDGDRDVALDSRLEVGFDHDMQASSLLTAFSVAPELAFTVEASGAIAKLKHAAALLPSTKYTVTVSKEATSTEGLKMPGSHVFSFTTAGGSGSPGGDEGGQPAGSMSFLRGIPSYLLVLMIMGAAVAAVVALHARSKRRERKPPVVRAGLTDQGPWSPPPPQRW